MKCVGIDSESLIYKFSYYRLLLTFIHVLFIPGEEPPKVTYTTIDETENPSDAPTDDKTTAIEVEAIETTVSPIDQQEVTTVAAVEESTELIGIDSDSQTSDAESIDGEVVTDLPAVEGEISTEDSALDGVITTDRPTVVGIESTPDADVPSGTETPSETEIPSATDVPSESDVPTEFETTVSPQEDKEGEVTTESGIIEATTLPFLELGECLKDGVVYENGTEVKPGKCEEFCVCEQGFVNCERKACPAPPPAFLRCAPLEDADQCCPTYDCRKF